MSGAPAPAKSGPPEAIAARIRAAGTALDHGLIESIYAPLLAAQPRDGVTVERDLSYGPDERHRLDVYLPEQGGAPPATVVFFHGGGFIRGDKRQRDNAGYCLARAGLQVIVPNYRLAPTHGWPAGAEDVVAVCAWAHRHAAIAGLPRTPLFLAGESAGAAHVALATLCRRFQPQGLNIAGAMLISGVYNAQLEWLARAPLGIATPDVRNEAYFGTDPKRYPAQSTVTLIDAAPFPLLLTFAELDLLQMQVQAGELFAALVVKHGFRPELQLIRDHNHLTQVYAINTGDNSLSAPLLDFVRRHLPDGTRPA